MGRISHCFLVFTLIFFNVCAAQTSDTNITLQQKHLEDVEVPDSSVLLLDRLKFRKLSTLKYYGRQNEDNETETENRRCTCNLGVCKCCTGPLLDLINQKACMRVTYHPGDFAFDVAMSLNDRILYENSLSALLSFGGKGRTESVITGTETKHLMSQEILHVNELPGIVPGKNPRPICINPPRLTNLKFCARFYNVFFPGRNFHFCLEMSGKWRSNELFHYTFDCLRMGANGITRVKPEENGGLPIPNPQGGVDAVIDSGDDIEEYDENVIKSLLDVFD